MPLNETTIFFMCSVQVGTNSTVNGIDYYISDTFGSGMYESCKEVKFGTMNTRAMEFIGAGAKNFQGKMFIPQCNYILIP